MTIEQMTTASKVFLIAAICFIILAILIYVFCDVRKAWQLLMDRSEEKSKADKSTKKQAKEERKNTRQNKKSGRRQIGNTSQASKLKETFPHAQEESQQETVILPRDAKSTETVMLSQEQKSTEAVIFSREQKPSETVVLERHASQGMEILQDITYIHTTKTILQTKDSTEEQTALIS